MFEPGLKMVVHDIPSIPKQRNIVEYHKLVAIAVCRDYIPLNCKKITTANNFTFKQLVCLCIQSNKIHLFVLVNCTHSIINLTHTHYYKSHTHTIINLLPPLSTAASQHYNLCQRRHNLKLPNKNCSSDTQ